MSALPDTALAILAGGRATRMGGATKALLELDGERLVDHQLRVARPLFAEILVCASEAAPYASLGLPVVPDETPGQGPLAGILAALEAARASRVVVVACDMPALTVEALGAVADPSAPEDIVVPVAGGRPEPLCARYGRACAPVIRRRLAAGQRKVADLLADPALSVRRWVVPDDADFLANCNTPQDLARLARRRPV